MRSSRLDVALLVVVNAFVGGMVGLERTVLPGLAEERFGLASATAATSFIVAFGVTKALVNLFAGRLADAYGRRRVLVAGWLVGIPVPLLILFAPLWSVVVAANVLLGVNQGLCWSMTVNMKLDLVGPHRRGLVVGLNETAGYTGLAVVAFATGYLAQPFWFGFAIALLGLALASLVRETHAPAASRLPGRPPLAASLGGLATNLKDGALWGLLPLALLAGGATLAQVAIVVAAYPLAWGLTQGVFGWWSDRVGRLALIVGGLVLQAIGVAWLALVPAPLPSLAHALAPALALGVGTAMAYPTLLARVADVAPPERRATALGVYRFWRDLGYAIGALGAGILADALGLRVALFAVAAFVALAAAASLVPARSSGSPA